MVDRQPFEGFSRPFDGSPDIGYEDGFLPRDPLEAIQDKMRVHFAELAEAGLIDPATFAELLVNVLDWTTMAFEAGLHTNLIHPKVDCAEGADVAVGQLPVELPNQREGRSD